MINVPLFVALNAVPFLWFIVEVVTMFTNDKRRALHDLIAGTVVVRTNIGETAALLPPPSLSPAV